MKESVLIERYRKTHISIRKNFQIKSYTIKHSPPKFQRRLSRLLQHLKSNKVHEFTKGRTTVHVVQDTMRNGFADVADAFDKYQASFQTGRFEVGEDEEMGLADIGIADIED